MTLKHWILAVPRQATMALLQPMESRLLQRAEHADPGAVFIVGPPRSGTTLLYELLVTRFRFGYISNAAHRLYLTPAAATQAARPWILKWRGDYTSTHGAIHGWGAPCEGGWIWNRWMPQAHWLDETAASYLPTPMMRCTAYAIAGSLNGPFLNKNVMHSVHMRVLDRVFPRCVFIEIRRNVADNVRSILRLRQHRNHGRNSTEWISVKPRRWREFADADPVTQACAQVLLTHETIHADAAFLGSDRLLTIGYESLCAHPEVMLQKIAAFLNRHGINLMQRFSVPQSFEPAPSKPLRLETEERIANAIVELQMRLAQPNAAVTQRI